MSFNDQINLFTNFSCLRILFLTLFSPFGNGNDINSLIEIILF